MALNSSQHLNCQHYVNGVCAHPSARRALLGNKPCVLIGDVRVSACQYQVERDRPMSPPMPPIFNSRQSDCDVVLRPKDFTVSLIKKVKLPNSNLEVEVNESMQDIMGKVRDGYY